MPLGADDLAACFSADYPEARAKFLSACEAAGFETVSHLNPVAKGPDGEDLVTDVASRGPAAASRVILMTSGTHGIEGYCGSGIQVALLREGAFAALPDDTRVVLVHALNPFGFAHKRRVNEDNIDLNRNFIDHAAGAPDSAVYSAIHPLVAPKDYGERPEHWDGQVLEWIQANGMEAFSAAISGGQYAHPDGLFYGGANPSWSNLLIRKITKEAFAGATQVRFMDIHTGLGPFGEVEKIGLGDAAAIARARAIWGEDVTDLAGGQSASAVVSGDISAACYAATGEIEDAAAIALEYGTVDPVSVLRALRFDNWLSMHAGAPGERAAPIKRMMVDAFYPQNDDWRESVVRLARKAVTETL